jgi:hypothetical protein
MSENKKPKYYYMHLLNGSPAFFAAGIASIGFALGRPVALRCSAEQIRREQKADAKTRRENGFPTAIYGIQRVTLPK